MDGKVTNESINAFTRQLLDQKGQLNSNIAALQVRFCFVFYFLFLFLKKLLVPAERSERGASACGT
jgi:hypothetical protein